MQDICNREIHLLERLIYFHVIKAEIWIINLKFQPIHVPKWNLYAYMRLDLLLKYL